MVGKIVITFLCVMAMATQETIASPFLDGAVPQKSEPRPSAPVPAPRPHVPAMPLPRLPSVPLPTLPVQQNPGHGSVDESPRQRWIYIGRIDNQVFVTDTQTGEMVSFPEGETLAGGCIATATGVLCGKDAMDRKAVPKENKKADDAHKLDELIFSVKDIAQKCSQFDGAFKSEMQKKSSQLNEHEAELKKLKTNLEIRKMGLEQLLMEQKALQEQLVANGTLKERDAEIQRLRTDLENRTQSLDQLLLEQQVLKEQLAMSQQSLSKAEMENVKIKDENAFLIINIALLEKVKGIRSNPPAPGDRTISDGSTLALGLNRIQARQHGQ
jgi:hypothetical protein